MQSPEIPCWPRPSRGALVNGAASIAPYGDFRLLHCEAEGRERTFAARRTPSATRGKTRPSSHLPKYAPLLSTYLLQHDITTSSGLTRATYRSEEHTSELQSHSFISYA